MRFAGKSGASEPIVDRPTLEREKPKTDISDEGNEECEGPQRMMFRALDSGHGDDEEDELSMAIQSHAVRSPENCPSWP